jgi:hypothetical protein
MWQARTRWLTRAAVATLSVLALSGLSAACASAPPPPDVTVFRWVQALAALDGATVAKLTCRANQNDVQTQRLLALALGEPVPPFGAGGGGQFFGGGGGGNAVYDVSDFKYQTTFADDQKSSVQVTGLLRMTSGLTTQVLRTNSTVGLTREQDLWRVCDPPAR